jgi:hypothetical protein
MLKIDAERRSEIAALAARARWKKSRDAKRVALTA